jgi:hypothetical protein
MNPSPQSACKDVGCAANAAPIANIAAAATVTLRWCIACLAYALCGGVSGGISITAAWGGVNGGMSVMAKWGGITGGMSVNAECGGVNGGISVDAMWGGVSGGISNCPKVELATAHPMTKPIKLAFIVTPSL